MFRLTMIAQMVPSYVTCQDHLYTCTPESNSTFRPAHNASLNGLLARRINVAFGHDCVMDAWYSLGSGDMLEVAHMGLHVAQMTSQSAMRQCFEAVTVNPARILGLPGYGLEVGCDASFVLLQARDPIEANRLRANRLKVWKKGKVLAETAEVVARLHVTGRPNAVGFFPVRRSGCFRPDGQVCFR